MDQREISITGVLSLHREGELLRPSFRSLLTALRRFNSVEAQRVIGGPALKWELVAVLDRADEETELVLREEIATHCAIERCRILKVEVGDLGLSRNEAVRGASGTFIGFLDGDDLCSRDWLVRAYSLCSSYPQRIAHPEYNLYFGREAAIFAHPRQKQYDLRALFFHNLWSALSFGPRAVYESVPYLANEISQGVGYEDWNWNCRTIDAGWTHEYVPQTCHFIRLKELSAALSAHSRNNACIIKPAGVWKSLTESGAVRDATEGAEDELSVLYRESAAERAPLFDLDPSIIDVSSLPVWLRDEAIECSEKGLPLLEKSQLFNFSPLTKNPFTDLLSGTLFEKVQRGIDAIHFVRSDLALCDIERALVIADERATVGGLAESLSLAELSPRLGEKLPLFVGMLALQSGCREVHLWDSELAGEIVSTVQRALVRYDIKLVWHQLVPGATPPDALMVGGKARSGWTLLPHCPLVSYQNAPGLPLVQDKLSVLYLVDIPREHRPWQQQCVWYRVIGPGKALEADGHRVMYLLMDDEPRWEALLQQRACDIVILHRGQSSAHFDRLRELTRQQSIPLCYDVDDNIICGAALSGASHLSNLSEARLREIDRWADSNGECMRACDAALLATAELEAVASGSDAIHRTVLPFRRQLSKRCGDRLAAAYFDRAKR